MIVRVLKAVDEVRVPTTVGYRRRNAWQNEE